MTNKIFDKKEKKSQKNVENVIKREFEKVKGLLDELLTCRKEIEKKLAVFDDKTISIEEKKHLMTDEFMQLQCKWDNIMMKIDPELVNKIRSSKSFDNQSISFQYLQQKKKKLLEEMSG